MRSLLRMELKKLRHFSPLYYILLYSVMSGIFNGAILTASFWKQGTMGTEVYWRDTVEFSYLFFSTLFVCLFIGSDFSDRSILNELRIGNGRVKAVLCRSMIALPVSAAVWLAYSIPALATYFFSGNLSQLTAQLCLRLLGGVLISAVNVMALMSFCVLLSFLIRKMAVALSLCAFLTIEVMQIPLLFNMESITLNDGILYELYRTTVVFRSSIPFPLLDGAGIALSVGTALMTIAVVIAFTCVMFRYAELHRKA